VEPIALDNSPPMTSDKIATYWLIPAEPALSHFRSLIRELAERFDAPVFEPHVTLYATDADRENPDAVLELVLGNAATLQLSIEGLNFSDEFTKTLFVQFRPDGAVSRLSEKLRSVSVTQCEYKLNPHLSLIYKTMPRETKERIANSIRLPFDEVTFDAVQAVISPAPIKSHAELEQWKTAGAARLTG
jgi:hypothetical protein